MATKPTSNASDRDRAGAALLTRFAPVTEAAIQEMTDDGSFSRGRQYWRRGAIESPTVRGDALRARCQGSEYEPYDVRATLVPAGKGAKGAPAIADYGCSCPRGGFCKHIVALLLTWVETPERFEERQPLDRLLAEKSREELVKLVELLVRRAPELEDLVELPLPVPVAADSPRGQAGTAAKAVDRATIRRQVVAALGEFDRENDWYEGDGEEFIGPLDQLLELADQYAGAGQWHNAWIVYTVIAEEVQAHEAAEWHDGVLGILRRCGGGLVEVLDAQRTLPADQRLTPDHRTTLVETVFDLWRDVGGERYGWDDETGVDTDEYLEFEDGEGDADPEERVAPFDFAAALLRNATPAERGRIEAQLRDLAAPGGGTAELRRDAIGFLIRLQANEGDDEGMLAAYLAAELWRDAADVLLRLGRPAEAVALAGRRLTQPHDLLAFANHLLAAGEDGVARGLALVDGRLWETEGKTPHEDGAYLDWLARRYAEHGRPAEALATQRRRFKARPNHLTYAEVKTAATLPGQPDDAWPTARAELLKTLTKQKDWSSLVEIHLAEGAAGDALAALKKQERAPAAPAYGAWGYSPGSGGQEERVAKAAEAEFPEESLRLYRSLADRYIGYRDRANYVHAAGYLVRVKEILERLDRRAEWRTLIAALREEHKRLRALREELERAGL